MLKDIINTEIVYVKKFTDYFEDSDIIQFRDYSLKDMRAHNYTYIKQKTPDLITIIKNAFTSRQKEDADFFRLESNFPIPDEILTELPLKPITTIYDYMYIYTNQSSQLSGNESCMIHKADEYDILTAGMHVDIVANQEHMGKDFAKRRIERKSEVYKETDSNLDLFVCYTNQIAIGNCELLHNNNIVKLEDFDILYDYQRKGYGTQFLKFLLEEAKKYGSEIAYVVTNQENSAKNMYAKCGFKKIGEKYVYMFNFQS